MTILYCQKTYELLTKEDNAQEELGMWNNRLLELLRLFMDVDTLLDVDTLFHDHMLQDLTLRQL